MLKLPSDIEKTVKTMGPIALKSYERVCDENDSWAVRWVKAKVIKKTLIEELIKKPYGITDTAEAGKNQCYANIRRTVKATDDRYKRPSYEAMFFFRNTIPINCWFYKYGEELPKAVKFESKYEKFSAELFAKPTLGHNELLKLMERYGINHLSESLGTTELSRDKLYNLVRIRKNSAGIITYRCHPTFDIMLALKEHIRPDFWFVYPEEIKK